jgi:glycosyltransferase involved in cell wall biosynthesis
MEPLVSILIPCYNAARWLPAALESALAQSWPRCEIVVVDDGSSDGSLAAARSFEARGVRVLAQANAGASAARNAALAASRGEWLQFLDADDLLEPGKIAEQMRRAATLGPEMALCARWSRFRRTPADADFTPQPLCADAAPVDWVVTKLGTGAMMHPAAWLISRALAQRAGPWNEQLSLDDDGEYFTRVVLASQGVRHCPAAVSLYRSNLPGSLSGRSSRAAWESAFRGQRLCAGHLLAAEDSPRARRACAHQFLRLAQDIYPDFPDLVEACEAESRRHGGSSLLPPGGRLFQLGARLFGWKRARRWQRRLRASRP